MKEPVQRNSEAVARFVDRFAAVLTEAGMPRMPSRIFVQLLTSDTGRMTAAELAAALRASAGAISGAVRYLIQVELVDREHTPGTRMDRYRVRADVWYAATVRKDAMLARWDPTLQAGIEALGADTPAGARLTETRAFFAYLQQELPKLLDRWNDHRAGMKKLGDSP